MCHLQASVMYATDGYLGLRKAELVLPNGKLHTICRDDILGPPERSSDMSTELVHSPSSSCPSEEPPPTEAAQPIATEIKVWTSLGYGQQVLLS